MIQIGIVFQVSDASNAPTFKLCQDVEAVKMIQAGLITVLLLVPIQATPGQIPGQLPGLPVQLPGHQVLCLNLRLSATTAVPSPRILWGFARETAMMTTIVNMVCTASSDPGMIQFQDAAVESQTARRTTIAPHLLPVNSHKKAPFASNSIGNRAILGRMKLVKGNGA